MTKIKIHILKIKKWNQSLEKETILNESDIKEINENDNTDQINNDISKPPTLS